MKLVRIGPKDVFHRYLTPKWAFLPISGAGAAADGDVLIGLCRKFIMMLEAARSSDAIMLRAPQRPRMASGCHWQIGSCGSYVPLLCPRLSLRLNETP